jgi:hypothetical protein
MVWWCVIARLGKQNLYVRTDQWLSNAPKLTKALKDDPATARAHP